MSQITQEEHIDRRKQRHNLPTETEPTQSAAEASSQTAESQ